MKRSVVAIAKVKVLLLCVLLLASGDVTSRERGGGSVGKLRTPVIAVTAASASASTAQVFGGDGLIAFVADEQVFVMNADGSGVRRLTDDAPGVRQRYAALSPDGRSVAFVRDDGLGLYALSVVRVDTKRSESLIVRSVPLGEPAWSPDGRKIAFVEGYDPTSGGLASLMNCIPEVSVIEVGTGRTYSLTQGAGGTDPAWSPDGTRLAFSSARGGNYDIYTTAPDGSDLQQLTRSTWAEAEPAWSPDGGRIAYVAHLTQAVNDCGFMPTGLSWSNGEVSSSVYVANADGTNQTGLAGTSGTIEMAWSPSGAGFVLTVDVKGDTQLYLTDAWGGSLTRLTSDPTQKSSPSWARPSAVSR